MSEKKKLKRFIFMSVFGASIYYIVILTTQSVLLAVVNSILFAVILDEKLLIKLYGKSNRNPKN